MIKIQTEDFNVQTLYEQLRSYKRCGAIVQFTGIVRDFNKEGSIQALHLEHYPTMTERCLAEIKDKAMERWPTISAVSILHRIGTLMADEQIVYVGVASTHRADGFNAATFIMDYLKNDAPFWKKEIISNTQSQWVTQKTSDKEAKQSWEGL